MKIRNYLLAAGICLLLTGCADSASGGKKDPIINVETSPLKKQTAVTEQDSSDQTTAAVTTLTETTTVTTTTEPPKPYTWLKEPFLEADDINVVPAESAFCNYGDFLEADFALIRRGDLFGMVDYDGMTHE